VAIKRLFVDLFLEAQERAPNEIILDLDATDDPVHGEQEGRFFHGSQPRPAVRSPLAGGVAAPEKAHQRAAQAHRRARWKSGSQ
jgi:Transposase DDE domain group 1